ALYENETPHEFRLLGPDTPHHMAEWQRRWPIGQFPLLVDDGRSIVETTIIIEYLQLVHPGPVRLLPEDPRRALDVRFLDRFFDLHVMHWVQHAVRAALKGDPTKRPRCRSPRLTGCTESRNYVRACAGIGRDCSHGHRLPERWTRRGRIGLTFRSARRIGIDGTLTVDS